MAIFFTPRIGSHYTEGWQGYRTLVLGVHHICSKDCPFNKKCYSAEGVMEMDNLCPCYSGLRSSEYHRLHNNNTVEMDSYIEDTANYPTYSLFTKFMLGRKDYLSYDDRSEFWEHVTFYNFLQHFLPDGNTPPYKGHEAMYDAAIPAFLEMIDSLPEAPQVIYVWSKPVHDCLVRNIDKIEGLKVESLEEYPQTMELYYFSLNTNIMYSSAWVEDYINSRLENGWYKDNVCLSLAEVLYRALCDGFLRAQDGEIVIPYNSSRHKTPEYGTFLQRIREYYRLSWKEIGNIIFKLNKNGEHQKQALRTLTILFREDEAYDDVMNYFNK